MSLENGMAALRLEMPDRIPRTEYSAHFHWDLVERVTGLSAHQNSPEAEKTAASRAFMEVWDYGFFWSVLIHRQDLEARRTRMGHAEYVAGGGDFDNQVDCPFADIEEVLSFDPLATYPRHPIGDITQRFEEHYSDNCAKFPDTVNMTGTYVTAMSGLIEIFGWDMLLMAAGTDPDRFGEVTRRYCQWLGRYLEALADSSVPVVMIHDDLVWTSGPFIHPDWYRRYIFPEYKRMFAPLVEAGKIILFTCDGDYTTFLPDVAEAGVSGFVFEPTTDLKAAVEGFGQTHALVGNVDTRVLLQGGREEIRAEVRRCMDLGRDCPGYFLSVGNHIPPNTPLDSALWYQEAFEEFRVR